MAVVRRLRWPSNRPTVVSPTPFMTPWEVQVCRQSWMRTPGSPWENGYCESFNGTLRDECLNGEIFYSLKEAQIVIELWREEYNTRRPHSALDYRPPALGACNPFLPPEPISQPQAVM